MNFALLQTRVCSGKENIQNLADQKQEAFE